MNRDCAFHRYFYFFKHVGIPIPFFFEIPLFHSPHFSSLLITSHHFSSLLLTSHHAQSIRNHAQSIFTTPYRFHQFSSLPIKNQSKYWRGALGHNDSYDHKTVYTQ